MLEMHYYALYYYQHALVYKYPPILLWVPNIDRAIGECGKV